MTSLLALYDAASANLYSQLKANAESPSTIVQILLNNLTEIKTQYSETLTVPQKRLLQPAFESLEASIQLLNSLTQNVNDKLIVHRTDSQLKLELEPFGSAVGAILAGTITGGALYAIPIIVSGSFIGHYAIKYIKDSLGNETAPPQEQTFVEYSIDTNKVLEFYKHEIQAISNYHFPQENKEQTLVTSVKLLEHIQTLLGHLQIDTNAVPDQISRIIKQLENKLMLYGIETKYYDPASSNDNQAMFIFEQDATLTEPYITVRPALTKNKSIILKGEVATPLSTNK